MAGSHSPRARQSASRWRRCCRACRGRQVHGGAAGFSHQCSRHLSACACHASSAQFCSDYCPLTLSPSPPAQQQEDPPAAAAAACAVTDLEVYAGAPQPELLHAPCLPADGCVKLLDPSRSLRTVRSVRRAGPCGSQLTSHCLRPAYTAAEACSGNEKSSRMHPCACLPACLLGCPTANAACAMPCLPRLPCLI